MNEASSREGPKRVLFLTLFGDLRRGGQHSLLLLASRLDPERYLAEVAVPHEGPLADALRAQGITTHVFGAWPHPLKDPPWKTLAAVSRLKKLVQSIRPDIIHSDAPRLAHIASLAGKDAKRVMHLRVSTNDGFSDVLLALHCNAMIAVSQGVADRFLRYPEIARNKIRIIYNGVDLERFRPRSSGECAALRKELELPSHDPIVTMLAAFVAFKRHIFVTEVWAEVKRRLPAHLVLAGSGGELLRREVEHRFAELGIGDSVTFLPVSSRPEELMACADLNLLASIQDEGLGRVIPEAAACGVPSIAADAPGVRETILPGLTGLLLPREAPAERWGQEIAALLQDGEQRRRLAANALVFARERFSAERHCSEVMEVYDQVLGIQA